MHGYRGNFARPILPEVGPSQRKPVQGTTNATPVIVQCTAHGFSDQASVELEGMALAPLSGMWQVTVIDADHYSLNGSTAPGSVGGAGGYAINYSIQPAINVLDDGTDILNSANIHSTSAQLLSDETTWLYRMAGTYRLYGVYELANINAPTAQPWDGAISLGGGTQKTWAQSNGSVTGSGVNFAFGNGTTGDFLGMTFDQVANGGATTTHPPIFKQNDLMVFEYNLSVIGNNGNGQILLFPSVTWGATTVNHTEFGLLYDMYGSPGAAAYAPMVNMKISGHVFNTTASQTGSLTILAQASRSTMSGLLGVAGPATLAIRHYRPN